MSKPGLHLFVDNSNVLLEGRRFAQMKKLRRSTLGSRLDESYEIDWGKFLFVVKESDSRILADIPYLYGSRPPPNDSVWKRIRDDGFDVKVFDRNIRNKEKGVDMELGMDVAERLFTTSEPGILLVAALRRDDDRGDRLRGKPVATDDAPSSPGCRPAKALAPGSTSKSQPAQPLDATSRSGFQPA